MTILVSVLTDAIDRPLMWSWLPLSVSRVCADPAKIDKDSATNATTSDETKSSGVLYNLAFALNPGLAQYPDMWWPTIRKLQHQRVPLIITTYGENLKLLYEYDQRVQPQCHGALCRLPDTEWLTNLPTAYTISQFPGFPDLRVRGAITEQHVDVLLFPVGVPIWQWLGNPTKAP